MKVTATLSNAHVSPRKARLVAGLIRGLDVASARIQLERSVKKTSDPMLKLLRSAVANAENNFSLDTETLWVSQVDVNEGQKLKRFMPRAQGRATPLWHRLSHISLVVEGEPVVKKPVARKKVAKKEIITPTPKTPAVELESKSAKKRAKTTSEQSKQTL